MIFKAGDKVKCIQSIYDSVFAGQIYTVLDFKKEYGNGLPAIYIEYQNQSGWWYAKRFIKILEKPSDFLDALKFNEENYYE